MKAVLCPVCQGSGKWAVPPYGDSTDAAPRMVACHGCGGCGWVVVPDERQPLWPWPMTNVVWPQTDIASVDPRFRVTFIYGN